MVSSLSSVTVLPHDANDTRSYRLARTASAPDRYKAIQPGILTIDRKQGDTHLDHALLSLNLRILDLAMVNDHGISSSPARVWIRPANALGELGIRVREEQLRGSASTRPARDWYHTISFPRTRLAFPQALMTNGSLKATTATMSTPFSRRLGRFSIYPGTWFTVQVGVKAPIHMGSARDGDVWSSA